MEQTIIFDFDGTIADSFIIVRDILKDLSSEFGYKKPNEKEIALFRTKHLKDVLKELKFPYYKLPFLALRVKAEMRKHMLDMKPISGIEEAFLDLKSSQYLLGIVTSNSEKNVKAFLEKNDLNFFNFIQSESNIFGKARVLNQVLKKQKINKSNAIYVGDEIRDIEAAHKIGLKSIAVTWGFNDKVGLQKFHPDSLIDKPSQLLLSIQALSNTI